MEPTAPPTVAGVGTDEELEPGGMGMPPVGDLSAAERLRAARREALSGDKLAVIEIPEYPDDLRVAVRYHALGGGEIEAVQQRAQRHKGTAKGTRACMEILAAACEGVYVRMPEHAQADAEGLVNIAAVFGLPHEQAVKFGDPRLAQALEFDQAGGKDAAVLAVRETFCRNEAAIIATQEALSRWFVNRNREVDVALLGE